MALSCLFSDSGTTHPAAQEGKLCGVHALNTLLQGPFFSEVDLAQVRWGGCCARLEAVLEGEVNAETQSHR